MAKVFLSSLTCHHKNESGSDEIWLEGSGFKWPPSGYAIMDQNKQVKLDKVIDFNGSYTITLKEDDRRHDDTLGTFTFNPVTNPNPNEKRTASFTQDDANYQLEYFYLPDSFKTVYIRGFKCERDTLGIDLDVIQLITGICSKILDATSAFFDKITYPHSDKIATACDIASGICDGVDEIAAWIAKHTENPDEFFITRANSDARDHEFAIYPVGGGYRSTRKGDLVIFEDEDVLVRFPLCEQTWFRLREYDPVKKNASLGIVNIPANQPQGSYLEAVQDDNDGEGALYYVVYSVLDNESWSTHTV